MRYSSARYAAIETLQLLGNKHTPLPIIFEQVCQRQHLKGPDRALAMNLIYGVLRNYQYLERLMALLCSQPLKKLHPTVFQALAVGLYQIFFLSRIPPSAAVNETVEAARAARIPTRLIGFVNGVLRQSIRRQQALPQPGEPGDDGRPIYNHPSWLIRRWLARFGRQETEAICRSNNERQPLTLRLTALSPGRNEYIARLTAIGIDARCGDYAPDAVVLDNFHGGIDTLPGYHHGHFQVQGEAAQLCTLLLQPSVRDGRWLDACAGVGGKSRHLLELIDHLHGRLVAVEPQPHRQKMFRENMAAAKMEKRCLLFPGSLEQYAAGNSQKFDGILVDAPCSGTGVLGRQPDIRWRRQPEDICRYAARQRQLLRLAARLLRPEGVLVYATCSLEVEENDEVVSSFLEENSTFQLSDSGLYLPQTADPLVRDQYFQPRPSEGIDGFFAARLVCNISDD
mgnify:CR=1 FL=1